MIAKLRRLNYNKKVNLKQKFQIEADAFQLSMKLNAQVTDALTEVEDEVEDVAWGLRLLRICVGRSRRQNSTSLRRKLKVRVGNETQSQ